jgi:Tfp pilus assembly protein PilF
MSDDHHQAKQRLYGQAGPAMTERLLRNAAEALAQGAPERAALALEQALDLDRSQVQAWRMLAVIRQRQGRHDEAVHAFGQALSHGPDDALLHMGIGISLYEAGRHEDACAAIERACELAPGHAPAWFNLGRMHKVDGHSERAVAALERALEADPGHLGARLYLAEAQTHLGHVAQAAAHYRDILRRQPSHPAAWNGLANLKTVRLTAQEGAQLRRLFRPDAAADDAQVAYGFALAKALEDLGEHPQAFDVLGQANALKRRLAPWNPAAAQAHARAIGQAFAQPLAGAPDATLGSEVIFVVSLPRSGSSLVEQILASHAQVEGGNELLDLQQVLESESQRRGRPFPEWVAQAGPADWTRLGQAYLARTARLRRHRPRFTDKNLINWRLVGAIRAMLPGARIVNCRRDPLETCLAGYRQLFSTGNEFSYSLEHMVGYWRDYDRLSRQWRSLWPEHVLDLQHEDLLAGPEACVRELLAFCELPFDPACLNFHATRRSVRTASAAQVRQPLQAATARADRYGDRLAPLRALLADVDPPNR